MSKLYNKHVESRWYHPITMMCYKSTDYGFQFCVGFKNHAFAKEPIGIWKRSGMKTGFKLINTLF